MSNTLFGSGGPILKIYNTDGTTTLKTLYLPAPDKKGGLILNWKSTAIIKTRIDGTQIPVFKDATKRYIPTLTVKYTVYEDLLGSTSRTLGTADGNTPTLDQLVSELSTYGLGRIAIAPGPGTPFFNCFLSKNIDLNPLKGIVYTNLTLEFTGTVALANMVLI